MLVEKEYEYCVFLWADFPWLSYKSQKRKHHSELFLHYVHKVVLHNKIYAILYLADFMLTGTKLLNHVFDLSAKQNISEIYLHVQTNNDDAIAFYKKFGFEITQTIHNYYMNIMPPDCYVLTKFIGQAATKK